MQWLWPCYKQKVHWRVKAVVSKAFLSAQFSMFFNCNGLLFGEDQKVSVCVRVCVLKVEYCPDYLPSTSATWGNMGFATGIVCPTL